jgi:formate/nitrite transporter FocA (FNT family)
MEPDTDRDEVEEIKAADAKDVHRAVREEGEDELDRPASSLLWSALAAGFAINASLIAQGALQAMLPEAAWTPLVLAMGYPIGFVIVVLGRMQFFTESTVTAMLPLVARPSAAAATRTVRLWTLVLTGNLAGTALATLVLLNGGMLDAQIGEGMAKVSAKLLTHAPLDVFLTAIPAGFLIAGLAWVLPNGREQAFFVIFGVTWVVGVAGFSHSVVGSAEAFLLVWHGEIGLGRALGGLIVPAVAGNLVGGAGLFAALAHGQVRGDMQEEA